MQIIDLNKDLKKVRKAMEAGQLFHDPCYVGLTAGANHRCAIGAMLEKSTLQIIRKHGLNGATMRLCSRYFTCAPEQRSDLAGLQALHDFAATGGGKEGRERFKTYLTHLEEKYNAAH